MAIPYLEDLLPAEVRKEFIFGINRDFVLGFAFTLLIIYTVYHVSDTNPISNNSK